MTFWFDQLNHVEVRVTVLRYYSAMVRSGTLRFWIALMALASFAVPAIGAHLHLCLDGAGTEPPASVHIADVGGLHPESADSGHDDVDLSLGPEALVKKFGAAPDGQNVLPSSPVLFVRPVATVRDLQRGTSTPIVRTVQHRILPPLRAPPV